MGLAGVLDVGRPRRSGALQAAGLRLTPIRDMPMREPDARARTLEEREILDLVARSEGKEWAERHAELILAQAHAIGCLEPTGVPPDFPAESPIAPRRRRAR